MTPPRRLSIVLTVLLGGGLIASPVARAQNRFTVTPLFSMTQLYDTNVLAAAAGPLADHVTRVSPGIDSSYRSDRLTLAGRFSFDVERFAEHSELGGLDARQQAALHLVYRRTPRLAMAFDSEFSKTQTPAELMAVTGLAFSRATARRLSGHASIGRQISTVTRTVVDYTVTHDTVAGGSDTLTNAASIGIRKIVSPRATLTADYKAYHFTFGTSSVSSQAVSVGWVIATTRRLTLSVNGGPRVTLGAADAEASASLRYALNRTELSTAYTRGQTTVIGFGGVAETQGISTSLSWSAGRVGRVRIVPGFAETTLAGSTAKVYQMTADLTTRVPRGLAVNLMAGTSIQQGNVYTGSYDQSIVRHTVSLALYRLTERSAR